MLLRGALVLTHFRPNDVEDTVDVDSGPAARPRLEIVHVVPPTTGSKSHSNNPQPGAYASLGSPWSYLTFNSMEKKKGIGIPCPHVPARTLLGSLLRRFNPPSPTHPAPFRP